MDMATEMMGLTSRGGQRSPSDTRGTEKKMAYTVVGRNPNSWSRTAAGDKHEIEYACGHHHRTLVGAVRCWRALVDRNTTDSLHAGIEVAAKDQQYDGFDVDTESPAYHEAMEEVRRRPA
jgi:hypothetical protein